MTEVIDKRIASSKLIINVFTALLAGLAIYTTIKLFDFTLTRKFNLSTVPELHENTMAVREKQLQCLAKNIYYEAGNEPFEGKVAVAQVTINRSNSGNFPEDICRVVYQKNIFYEKTVCQFSWYCDRVTIMRPLNREVYFESMEVAKRVLLEGYRLPSLTEAMYYHADYVNPGWRRERITKIGRHIFYR